MQCLSCCCAKTEASANQSELAEKCTEEKLKKNQYERSLLSGNR
jgi:hypothetical protein